MITKKINIGKSEVQGFLIDLNHAPLIVLRAKKGYVMCGYLNINTANKLGDIAGKITGVNTIEEALDATIVEVSEHAKKMGLHEGMKTQEFLNLLL